MKEKETKENKGFIWHKSIATWTVEKSDKVKEKKKWKVKNEKNNKIENSNMTWNGSEKN